MKNKKVFVIGTPEYENLGDSAIAVSQILFLKKNGLSGIEEITQSEYNEYKKAIDKSMKNALICGIGGGNMGNVWYAEELFRYSFLDKFRENKIVIFPQTIYYTPDGDGRGKMQSSVPHYEGCKNLTLAARERESFNIMKDLYPGVNVILTPDIVLSSTMEDYGVRVKKREGALCVFRSDIEKSLSDGEEKLIFDFIKSSGLELKKTDMYADTAVTKENRRELVGRKMQEFADSRLVITDRLHGMIFSAITGTPCIVFANNNHKVTGTYEWLKNLDYIAFANTAKEAAELVPQMLKLEDCRFDGEKFQKYFEPLRQAVDGENK